MNYISAENIGKSFSDRWLFRNISFGVSRGEKVAIVGPNGIGKSTLLNILAGSLPADEGKVSTRKEISIGFLSQNPDFEQDLSIMDTLFSTGHPALSAIKLYEQAMEHPENSDLMDKAITQMDATKAWEYESEVKQILGKLDIHDLEKKISQLSGGQRKRVALARVLIEHPDLLIMDEPTNHLDLGAIEWLEHHLSSQNITLILITHDRYFLDAVTNTIVEIDRGQLYRYQGNYGYFLEKKAEREAQQTAETEKARNLLRKELEWMRRMPKARGTKAKYRIDAFYELKEKAAGTKANAQLELSVKTTRLGNKIIELDHVYKSFGAQKMVDDFTYVFKKQDRIGIVGKNGIGKTTFLNLLTGNLQPDKGTVDKGDTTQIGYYTQQELVYKDNQRVIELVQEIAEVVTLANGQTLTASQFLNLFLFPPAKQWDLVAKLSGGEKRRLQLLRVLIKNPNFLILDEPTNDLDLTTLNVLEDFLENFGGCLLLVSHDRYFMDRLVDHLFVFEGEGKIRDFPGNYTDYREWLEDKDEQEKVQAQKASKPEPVVQTSTPTQETAKRKLSFKEQKEYETLEKEIEELEEKKSKLVAKLNTGSPNHEEITGWAKEIETIERTLGTKTDRWLELAEYI
ncbi:ABC-F family ATP-binding cassette domain-containing protein [Cytophagaceae bacterium YF14B1]|uniref:ABC-F family ATP-binding cassette domain-containing protein n=1 Tax=Xanthocytophaga flava TaxID=3048013 RepID=A0AAE3QYB8_9BACT|nr:ABC-F family ATP-binding cassette domain-containing protein [Xanthocytophaga flavus]MDJ1485698.1 ABC-F family ATP-binding cassette domain-containing protein [Xanthocytophaga flavus]